jgi:glycosyltransferase involved in cell wall biosynthesis
MISVIIPMYKRDFSNINKILENLSAQTYSPQEVIFAVSDYMEQTNINCQYNHTIINEDDTKSQYIDNKTPYICDILFLVTSGKCYAGCNRNRGASIASNDIICFIDADDLTHISKFELIKNTFLKFPNANMITHDYHKYNGNLYQNIKFEDVTIIKIDDFKQNSDKPFICMNQGRVCYIHHGHVSVKKEVLKHIFQTNKPRGQDVEFCQNVMKQVGNVYNIDVKLIIYKPDLSKH